MKSVRVIVSVAAFFALTDANAAIDQQFEGQGVGNAIGQCCTHIAQTFTAGLTGDLVAVSAEISHYTNNLTLAIYATGNDGRPIGGDLSSVTVPPEVPVTLTRKIMLSAPVPVIAGTKYALVATVAPYPSGTPIPTWSGGWDGVTYGGGEMWAGRPGFWWLTYPNLDLSFKTYVTPPGDPDEDGVDVTVDNCPTTANPGQLDMDFDGLGDLCDEDRDGDGFLNDVDNCPSTFNPDQADTNFDGYGDACVDPTVIIPPGAVIDPTVTIGANTTINHGVRIGVDSDIGTGTVLMQNVQVGVDVTVGDSVTLNQGSSVGDGSLIGNNDVINKGVFIGDNVVIGEATIIGQGAVICSGANIGDSVIIGKYVLIQTNAVVPGGSSFTSAKTAPSPSQCTAP